MTNVEETLRQLADESEHTRAEPDPEGTVFTRPNRAGSVVQSVRLPADTFDEIERLAHAHDIPVGALIRGWVLEGLAAEKDVTLESVIDRLSADVQRVARLAKEHAA